MRYIFSIQFRHENNIDTTYKLLVVFRDVRNRFFNFGSVSVRFLKKNSDSVRNEFGSVWFTQKLGSVPIVIYY